MLNSALRQKLGEEEEFEKKIELVNEALIEENKRTARLARETASRLATTERLLAAEAKAKNEAQEKVESESQEIISLRNTISGLESTASADREAFERRIAELEDASRKTQELQILRERKFQVLALWIGAPSLALVSLTIIFFTSPAATDSFLWWVVGISVVTIVWIALLDHGIEKEPDLKKNKLLGFIHKFRVWLFGALAAIFFASMGEWVYDSLIKPWLARH